MASAIDWPGFDASNPVDTLVKLSHYYGSDPSIVLAGGGNTSAKLDDGLVLLVKGSGHALATIPADGFVEMDRQQLLAILETPVPEDFDRREEQFKELTLACRRHPAKAQRPSVECLLHAIVPGQFVVHSHATLANVLSCCQAGKSIAAELFGDDVLWIPYAPGWMLAKVLADCLRDYTEKTGLECPKAFLMQNHGLTVSGDGPGEIREKTDHILQTIAEYLRREAVPGEAPFGLAKKVSDERAAALTGVIGPALRGALANDQADAKLPIVTFDDGGLARAIAAGADGKAVALGGALIPDQVVYCKTLPAWFDPADLENEAEIIAALRETIENYRSERGFAPLVILVAGLGMFSAGPDLAGASTAGAVYRDAIEVMSNARNLGGVKYLSEQESVDLENWELENYRRAIASGAKAGRAEGKVAVVTGGAQGLGLEIAQALARAGAHVVLADINADGASAAAEAINDSLGKNMAISLAMNVADGESVARAIAAVVRKFGGLDLLVSNAGVLRAESVKTQSQQDFDFVTNVNYKGFFICVQQASAVLATQHECCPSYRSDIIQINSKSGLVGSNRNGAYAGSKFGGLGLVQSFAMELIEDGVKVNAICPGNFFDGPLWSDPDNGLFVQYLRTGKIPGAKTLEDVRKGYEAKVPMGRGCRTDDVMKAIYYIIEQQYETGQALPVTGGQVMLK